MRARHIEISDPNGNIVDNFPPYEHWRKLDNWSDLDRITRQQSFIRKLAGLAISKSLSDPFLAVKLADHVLQYVKADEGLSRDDVNALIRAFKTVDVNDSNAVRFETLPVGTYEPDPNRVIASAAAEPVIEQLRTFGNNAPKPATVQAVAGEGARHRRHRDRRGPVGRVHAAGQRLHRHRGPPTRRRRSR